MSTEQTSVQKFDPSQLMEGVRDRIKATFVSLIPDAQWEELVKAECDKFFQIKENYSSYDKVSPFGRIVEQELAAKTKEMIKEYLGKEWTTTYWNGGATDNLNENLKKLIVEKSGEVLIGTLGSMLQATINQMKQNNY